MDKRIGWFLKNNQNGEILGSAVKESVLRINILSFFQANPRAVDTAAGLARRLQRAPEEIKSALVPLVRLGIIQKKNYHSAPLYQLKNGQLIASLNGDQGGDTFFE
jgi:hypothetical protein